MKIFQKLNVLYNFSHFQATRTMHALTLSRAFPKDPKDAVGFEWSCFFLGE